MGKKKQDPILHQAPSVKTIPPESTVIRTSLDRALSVNGLDPVIPQKAIAGRVFPCRSISEREIWEKGHELIELLHENTDPMTAYVILKQAEEILKIAKELGLDPAMTAMRGKEMNVLGAVVTSRRVVEYEYDDPTIRLLEDKIAGLKTQIDERKKMMRTIKDEVASTGTGEVIKPAKKIRDGMTIAVSFKKTREGL